VKQLEGLRTRFKGLAGFEKPDKRQTNSPQEFTDQQRANQDRIDRNNQEFQEYLGVLWDLLVIDQSWRDMRSENKDTPGVVGGLLHTYPGDLERESIDVLRAWQEVALEAKNWFEEFERDGNLTKDQLSDAVEFFEKNQKAPSPADQLKHKQLVGMFPPVKSLKEWQTEIDGVEQRLKAARKKANQSSGDK
jgi:hypothetical protein